MTSELSVQGASHFVCEGDGFFLGLEGLGDFVAECGDPHLESAVRGNKDVLVSGNVPYLSAFIEAILRAGCGAQVIPSVIEGVEVNMIYLPLRPLTCHVEERGAVNSADLPTESKSDIPVISARGDWAGLPVVASSLDPIKNSAVGVVAEVFQKIFMTPVRVFHVAPSAKSYNHCNLGVV